MTEIEIYHDFTHCNHYIPNKIINLKNHKQYIFQILWKQASAAVVQRTISIKNIKTYKTAEARLKKTSFTRGL